MKLIFSLLLAFCVGSTSLFAQDYQAFLMKDMVAIESGKYKTTGYSIITFSDGHTLQVKSYAEAPASGVISRDHFVALFSILAHSIGDEFTKGDEGAKSKDVDELIGNPDVVINCFMTKNGIQVEIKTNQGTNRQTMKWSDLF
ncbi:MAG: hypothetical protein SFU91_05610 [Chloroherpetonaceae bacterium]|nr:hypothetical protein [Chloroherpetonaceae bacterium]